MKLIPMTALALALVASPAFALKVTNLDTVARTVELSGNGAPDRRTIQPNDTEYFTGASTGRISLVEDVKVDKKGKAKAKTPKHESVVHADGMLSGIIGNETNTLTADPDNTYVIWPGGHLNVQSRLKRGGAMF